VQTPIDHNHDFDFAKGLRAILRQDPDIIMVGEIRDQETAETALQAALTAIWFFPRCTPTMPQVAFPDC